MNRQLVARLHIHDPCIFIIGAAHRYAVRLATKGVKNENGTDSERLPTFHNWFRRSHRAARPVQDGIWAKWEVHD